MTDHRPRTLGEAVSTSTTTVVLNASSTTVILLGGCLTPRLDNTARYAGR